VINFLAEKEYEFSLFFRKLYYVALSVNIQCKDCLLLSFRYNLLD